MKRHYYFKKNFLIFISILILSAVSAYAAEESITLTTYYPSPYGVYNEMRLYPKASPTACQEGLMFYSNGSNPLYSQHGIYVCGASGWKSLGGGKYDGLKWISFTRLDAFHNPVGTSFVAPVPDDWTDATIQGWAQGLAQAFHWKVTWIHAQATGQSATGPTWNTLAQADYTDSSAKYPVEWLSDSAGSSAWNTNPGSVGIGTTNPISSAKLHVAGHIYTPNSLKAGNLSVLESAFGPWGITSNKGVLAIGYDNGYAVGAGQNAGGETGLGISSNGPMQAGAFYITPGLNELRVKAYNGRSFNFLTSAGVVPDYSRLFIRNSDGYVGIGTTNPGSRLHVVGTMGCQFPGSGTWGGDLFHVAQEGGRPVVRIRDDDGGNNPVLQFAKGDAYWMNLEFNGDTITIGGGGPVSRVRISNISIGGAHPGYSASWPYETMGLPPGNNLRINFGSTEGFMLGSDGWGRALAGWTTYSDQRFKENVVELTNITNALKNIRGVRFNWKTKDFPKKGFSEGTQIGFIAQEVEKEFPELVATDPDGYKSLDYGKLTPVLLEAIKEQQKQIEEQHQLIQHLQLEVDTLNKIVGKGTDHA